MKPDHGDLSPVVGDAFSHHTVNQSKPVDELQTPAGMQDSPDPVITIMHASVGSGHKTAAKAIAEAVDSLRGTHGVPANVRIDVLDILDFGRIHFDGNKTAASFTSFLWKNSCPPTICGRIPYLRNCCSKIRER